MKKYEKLYFWTSFKNADKHVLERFSIKLNYNKLPIIITLLFRYYKVTNVIINLLDSWE